MKQENPATFAFVIDTDTYTGRFYRELAAFCTGVIGEDAVGWEAASSFHRLHGEWLEIFKRAINPVPDPKGGSNPSSVWPTEGRFNDGYGHHFDDEYFDEVQEDCYLQTAWPAYESIAIHFNIEPTPAMLDIMIARAIGFAVAPTEPDLAPFTIKGAALVKMHMVEERTELFPANDPKEEV